MKTQIHFGMFNIFTNTIKEVRNIGAFRPDGGLWTSDATDRSSLWIERCLLARDRIIETDSITMQVFEVLDSCRILHINSREELEALPRDTTEYATENISALDRMTSSRIFDTILVDYELLSQSYDAIHIACILDEFDAESTLFFRADHLHFIEERVIMATDVFEPVIVTKHRELCELTDEELSELSAAGVPEVTYKDGVRIILTGIDYSRAVYEFEKSIHDEWIRREEEQEELKYAQQEALRIAMREAVAASGEERIFHASVLDIYPDIATEEVRTILDSDPSMSDIIESTYGTETMFTVFIVARSYEDADSCMQMHCGRSSFCRLITDDYDDYDDYDNDDDD